VSEPIDLTFERLTRLETELDAFSAEVDKRFTEVDKRFDGLETALGKIVTVLEAHDQRLETIAVKSHAQTQCRSSPSSVP
jgi:hypothetical protein